VEADRGQRHYRASGFGQLSYDRRGSSTKASLRDRTRKAWSRLLPYRRRNSEPTITVTIDLDTTALDDALDAFHYALSTYSTLVGGNSSDKFNDHTDYSVSADAFRDSYTDPDAD
jgi:hypothetical protein